MDLNKAKSAYYKQRDAAKRRGIQWLFTFDVWAVWWRQHLGADWQAKRGQASKQYCMARKGDKGPYAPSNVKCITSGQNASEMRQNGTSSAGEKHGCVKLTEKQAIAVRRAKGTLNEIGLRFGIHRSTVQYIKRGSLWKHLKTPVVAFTKNRESKIKLNEEQVIKIYLSKEKQTDLAIKYGVTHGNISAIWRGRSWGTVTSSLTPPIRIRKR